MLSSLFTESSVELDLMSLFLCILTSLALGLLVACVHMYRSTYSRIHYYISYLADPGSVSDHAC